MQLRKAKSPSAQLAASTDFKGPAMRDITLRLALSRTFSCSCRHKGRTCSTTPLEVGVPVPSFVGDARRAVLLRALEDAGKFQSLLSGHASERATG